MPYINTSIIARRGYSDVAGLDDVWEKIKAGAGAALDYYGSNEQAKGAAAAQAAQNAALTAALAGKSSSSGFLTPTTMAIGAVAAVGLVLFLRKK
jgi:hypothetical protein